jgi:hypothetical protein
MEEVKTTLMRTKATTKKRAAPETFEIEGGCFQGGEKAIPKATREALGGTRENMRKGGRGES